MRSDRIRFAALLAMLAGCASGGPHQFGAYRDLAPKVAPTAGERFPVHVTVQLGRPANVAVFRVIPGCGSMLLFPEDSTQSGYVEAGSHLVETSYAKSVASDSSRLIRRPAGLPPQTGNRPGVGGRGGGRVGGGCDAGATLSFNQRGYLMIYASQQPLSYTTLSTKVAGISIPISDDDALNTVQKLIRETTRTTGPWAAYATDYPP